IHGGADDAVRPVVEPVEAQLMRNIQPDEDTAGDANGKAKDVDERVELIFSQVAPGDLNEAFEHGTVFRRKIIGIGPDFLLRAKAFHWVSQGRAYGPIANGERCDQESKKDG